ncbi:MAG TPA: hypothetical protein VIK11_12110 [Tepidiformaceae bacterium]
MKRITRRIAACLMVAAALTGACGGPAKPAPGVATQAPTATETSIAMSSVDYAMKVRSSYGLRFDRAYVESVESDPTASRELGIALTADEVSEVKASHAPVLLVLEPLTRELEADPTFAGLYIDQAAGGVLDIATTADVSHFAPVLARFASNDVRFRVRRVSYTLAELKSLQARVTSDVASWQGQGIQISTVGVDVVNNRLAITVVALTPAAKASIEASYGPRVAVSAGEAFHF